MSVSSSYGQVHEVFLATARDHGVTLTDVRVLVAVFERDGGASTADVADETRVDPSGVRRSSLTLRYAGLITASDGNGGPPKRGSNAWLALTLDGRRAALEALTRIWTQEAHAA